MTQNVVLITVDSLRADHCGFLGYDGDTTPTLDAKAEEGVVFENAIAPSSGTPYSMPQVVTGLASHERFESFDRQREQIRTHLASHQTIQEWFRANGYATLGFTPNPFTSRYFGFDVGFDHYEDFLGGRGLVGLRRAILSRWATGGVGAGLRLGFNMVGLGDLSLSWERYYEDILAQVRAAPEPFFLWVFLMEPHWPYRPPARYREASRLAMYRQNWQRALVSDAEPTAADVPVLEALYDGTIRHVDEFVDRLATDLADEDPAVVVHADHGEAFGEHGTFGHHAQLYEENVHVPLVAWNVGRSDRVGEPLSLRRVPALLRDVATRRRPDLARHASPLVSARVEETRAVRGRSVKLLGDADGWRLYDLASDPGESDPTAIPADHPVRETLVAAGERAHHERRCVADATTAVAAGGGPLGS